MAELDAITASLRQSREDLEKLIETGSSRSEETTGLLKRIEDLRRRAEDTQKRGSKSR